MSDIYLQITETPTVVTLSAPVVSGALASTVTVANTVTVALDSNSLSALENVTVTVGAAITGTVTVSNFPSSQAVTFSAVTISNFPATQTIAGTVTANAGANVATAFYDGIAKWANGPGGDGSLPIYVSISSGQFLGGLQDGEGYTFGIDRDFPIAGTVGISSLPSIPAGTNRIGVVTISGGTVTLGASTAQIGSVTASISGTVPVSISSVTIGNSVTIGSLPAISGTVTVGNTVTIAGTVTANLAQEIIDNTGDVGTGGNRLVVGVYDSSGIQFGDNKPFPISGTVTIGNTVAIAGTVTAVNHQGTAVTTSNFTSTTPSTILASANSGREVLTIFNEGAGNLHICAGATCTTIAYQVRLSAGDYYEVPLNQTSLTHSAVFATAGTARVTQVS